MASSLPLLIASLLAVSPDSLLPQKPPTNRERAKMGLLPRRSAPARVTYFAEAARSRKDVREFPEQDAPVAVLEDVAEPPVADAPQRDDVLANEPAGEPVATPAAVLPAPEPPAAAAPAIEVPPVPVLPLVPVAPVVPPSAIASSGSGAPETPPPAAAPRLAEPEPGPAPAPAQELEPIYARRTGRVALVAERVVDGQGRLIVRLLGARRTVLSQHVTGTVDDLPIQWSGRTAYGEVVEVVEDSWGPLEVHRDPVGRFLWVRTLADWEEEE